jgi:hypothetical protein
MTTCLDFSVQLLCGSREVRVSSTRLKSGASIFGHISRLHFYCTEMVTAADVEAAYVPSPLYTAVMLSVCGVGGGGVVVLLPPPHPAIPAARHPKSRPPAQAYASFLGSGAARSRPRLISRAANNKPAKILLGPAGTNGPKGGRRELFVGLVGGVKNAKVVVSIAVHVPGVEAVPAVGVQVAGVPNAAVPFMN